MHIGRWTLGFHLMYWGFKWKAPHEYWLTTAFGPFYILHPRSKAYWEQYDKEMAELDDEC